jgi:hypothetical protein
MTAERSVRNSSQHPRSFAGIKGFGHTQHVQQHPTVASLVEDLVKLAHVC